jgi:hypothetical protein
VAGTSSASHDVETGVGGHPIEPGPEFDLARRRRRTAERLDEHVLSHVPGLLTVVEDPGAEVVDAGMVVVVDA